MLQPLTKTAEAEPAFKFQLTKEITLPTAVLAVAAGPDGGRVFAACLDGGVYEVVIETGKNRLLAKHSSYASGVEFLPKAGVLISAGYDGTLRWHDSAGQAIRTIQAHRFWSWQMAVSPDEKLVATVTGQYLAGGYKYEPAAESEPSVKVFDAVTGELRHSWAHVPPVLSVAFSPDSRFVAAANMMGEIRVWDVETGKVAAAWNTPSFTSWGIIKSHHYIGGIFGLSFSADGTEILACGMGPMNDPMAGNGKQTWQRFAWRENPPRKVGEIKEGDSGNGLMETIVLHPADRFFVMAGRLAQGKWNVGFFEASSGQLIHSADTKMRVVDAVFLEQGKQLLLAGAAGQEKKKNGKCPDFGRLKVYSLDDGAQRASRNAGV